MVKRLLPFSLAILLVLTALRTHGAEDNAASALGFVCRIVPAQNIAVITPLSGVFAPDSRIRFYDDNGVTCGTGVVRSAYPDMVYISFETGSVECLKKGFIASSPLREEEAKAICQYSMNIPMVVEKGGTEGHTLPPNTIVLRYGGDPGTSVHFRHYAHDLGCRSCHHKDLDTRCNVCHPLQEGKFQEGKDQASIAECLRQKCMGCHKSHEGKSADCTWCHK